LAHWLLKISQNIHNGAAIVLHFGDPSWSWISTVSDTTSPPSFSITVWAAGLMETEARVKQNATTSLK
jgi:hypothetical protein